MGAVLDVKQKLNGYLNVNTVLMLLGFVASAVGLGYRIGNVEARLTTRLVKIETSTDFMRAGLDKHIDNEGIHTPLALKETIAQKAALEVRIDELQRENERLRER